MSNAVLDAIEVELEEMKAKATTQEEKRLVEDAIKKFENLTVTQPAYHTFLTQRNFFFAYERAHQRIYKQHEVLCSPIRA